MLRGAAAMSWLLGLGFGIPGVIGMVHLARTGEIWTLMGFPTYGHGPFERMGLGTSTGTSMSLMAAFVAVCAAELVTGTMLWTGASGVVAATWVLLPFELAFWIGFALPFGPVLAVARTVLILLA
jgi:hypothetical protein